MISRVRLEMLLEGGSGELHNHVFAMRAIVEDIAARTPFLIESQTGEWWYDCAACGAGSQESPDAIDHDDDCMWVRCVALVGPASGARKDSNPLEFEGVGEERS